MRVPALIALLSVLAAAPARGEPPVAERFVQTDGGRLYVRTLGRASGTPLLILNGGPGFPHDYILTGQALRRLAARRRVVVYDQRGTGRSDPLAVGASCTGADNVRDVDAVRAALGAERVDIYGHSWGGLLAMLYVERYPQHVRRLVIADAAAPRFKDTPFRFDEFFPDGAPLAVAAAARGDTSRRANDLESYLAMIFVSPEKREAFLVEMKTAHAPTMEVNAKVVASLDSLDAGPGLGTITCPTLVVTGRYDTNVAPINAWKIRNAIPGAQWHVFEMSSHLPFYEEPDEFVRVMNEFFGAP